MHVIFLPGTNPGYHNVTRISTTPNKKYIITADPSLLLIYLTNIDLYMHIQCLRTTLNEVLVCSSWNASGLVA